MAKQMSMTLTEEQHSLLLHHLFPGDGLEAAAVLVCSHAGINNQRLLVRKVLSVPYDKCSTRMPMKLTWPGEYLEQAIDAAEGTSDAIVLLHSHPGGYFEFSEVDDESDQLAIPCLHQAVTPLGKMHGSAIMTPDGKMRLRLYDDKGSIAAYAPVTCVGHNITDLDRSNELSSPFGQEMRDYLGKKTVCVVGASGTGSIIAELLARDNVGHLILIDFDRMERKNLNRILNSKIQDADNNVLKVDLIKQAISKYSPETKVTAIPASISTPEAIKYASGADIIFSCVDSMEGRMICERLCRCCLIPVIDMGVTIPTRRDKDGNTKIIDICGRIDYVHPAGASLYNRGVVTSEGLTAEFLMQENPEMAQEQMREGYIKGTHEEAPSVLFLNMRAASEACFVLYARLFGYYADCSSALLRTEFSLSEREYEHRGEGEFDKEHFVELAAGLSSPLLGLQKFSFLQESEAAE